LTTLVDRRPAARELGVTTWGDRDELGIERDPEHDRVAARGITGMQREYTVHRSRAAEALAPVSCWIDGVERRRNKPHDIAELGELGTAPALLDHVGVAINSEHLDPMVPSLARTPGEQQ